ncbi:hypothetical protein BKA62DRAFT_684981 [Auriculariales sp. MPI-PUGE-AT-0066]|nr:hypothetical protein BKA62DRAFT_684981 [Auriculariales sp. MPI-PUGE-AT-0066]
MSTASSPQLAQLPPELFERIFALLCARDIYALAATCTLLQAALDASPETQFRIELEVSGMAAGPLGQLSTRDALDQVKAKQRAWEQLTVSDPIPAPFFHNGWIWDLFGGVFGQGSIANGVRNRSNQGRKFHFTQLPGPGHDEITTWSFPDIGVPHGVRDFTFDPGLDLMLLIGGADWPLAVHIRHLSTNEPHSEAASQVFYYTRAGHNQAIPQPHRTSFYIQIVGDLFGVLRIPSHPAVGLLTAQNELIVANWRTGQLIATLMSPDAGLLTFSFISPEHFVVGVGDEPTGTPFTSLTARPRLQVFHFDRTPDLKAYDANSAPAPILTCELHLPVLAQDHFVEHLLIRSDPATGANIAAMYSRPFALGPEDRLLVVTVPVRRVNRHQAILEDVLEIFVRMSSLLEFSAVSEHEMARATLDGKNPKTFSVFWEGWSHVARAISVPFGSWQPTWVCYVYGLRFIMAVSDNDEQDDAEKRICIFDFNQMNVRRAAHRRKVLSDESKEVQSPTGKTQDDAEPSRPRLAPRNVDADTFDPEVAEEIMAVVDEDEMMDSEWTDDEGSDADDWRQSHRSGQKDTMVQIYTNESEHVSNAFADPVRSSLPYMVSTSGKTYDCRAMLIDEDNIVCLSDENKNRKLVFLPLY